MNCWGGERWGFLGHCDQSQPFLQRLLWSYDTGDWAQYSPTVSGGMVYLGALAEGDHRVHALDAMTGEVLWFAERPYPFTPEFTPTVAGDKVYVPGGFGEFHALDASTVSYSSV